MQFKKFTDIENVSRKRYIDKIVEEGHGGKPFVVTEKIHGANCGLYYDGNEFKIASRSQFVSLDGNFYGIKNHVDRLKDNTIKVYNALGGSGEVIIYGEWFGGRYAGMVSPQGSILVQRECMYCPHNEFCAFDIVHDGIILNYYDRIKVLENSGFYYSKALLIGSLQECLDYPNDFITKIPRDFGLSDIEGNICEGTVIIPVEPLNYSNGTRIILKNKNSKFKENNGSIPKVKEDILLSCDGKETLNILLGYVNSNKRNAVVSKFGNISDKDFGLLLGEYIRDIVDDYRKDYEKEIGEGLDLVEEKKIKKELSKAVQIDIRDNFVEILDGFQKS